MARDFKVRPTANGKIIVDASDFASKGGLLVGTGSGAYALLTGGSADQMIVADPTTSTGLRWIRHVINILTYGADPTGVADSTSAIQAAVDAAEAIASPGTTAVLFPIGEYKTSAPILIRMDHIVLVGMGAGHPTGTTGAAPYRGGTIIRPSASFAGDWVFDINSPNDGATTSANGVLLQDFSIDGNNMTEGGGIYWQVNRGWMTRLKVVRTFGDGIYCYGNDPTATYPLGAWENDFTNVLVGQAGGDGFVFLEGASDQRLVGCSARSCVGNGLYSESAGIQINGSYFADNGRGITTIARQFKLLGSRVVTCDGGLYIVGSASEGGGFNVNGTSFRNLSPGTTNTTDGINIEPTGAIKGGIISGCDFSSGKGSSTRMRYGVNVVNSLMEDLVIGPNTTGYESPATGIFGTGYINDLGTRTKIIGGIDDSGRLYDKLGNGVMCLTGSGSPEGAVTAPVGSTYQRSDGVANAALYIKETGSGNTGWRPIGVTFASLDKWGVD